MNNFLRTGQKGGGGNDGAIAQSSNASGSSDKRTEGVNFNADCDMRMNVDHQQKQQHQSEYGDGGESSALTEMKMITSNQPKIAIDMDSVLKVIENAENGKNPSATGTAAPSLSQANHSENYDGSASNVSQMKESHKRGAVTGPDPTKPLQPKAKLLRQQRKAEKLLAKANASPAIETAETATAAAAGVTASNVKKVPNNTEKTLKSFITEAPTDGKHQLKVR